ncbi:only proline and serin are matching in the corresponding protein [Diplodia corticola]|uniref:Only prolin and serin are matching in the corresponding protein n=1 Tax=Diplodia corticola TaxID=236234 RepID=A0A1J9QYW2_9PEZI|nr:only proline and serin are matching in the corresponding protein [Diplodia corticola]OJD33592.1 only prolin and serin are matching in the corresponding protein [Diplodia corticola]
MRDLKPLMLPKLAPARDPLTDSPTADERACQLYPDSSFSASECSTPLSQTFSTNGHVRHSSSLSSLSSSPPSSYEHLDSMTSSSKLPRLPEDPLEGPFASDPDDDDEVEGKLGSWCLCSVAEGCPHGDSRTAHSTPSLTSPVFEFADGPFGDDGESRYSPRRRRSGDSPASISSRVGERFPSLTRKWKDRRTPSGLSRETTRASTPSGGRSSRASSNAGSVVPSVNASLTELPQSPARSSIERDDELTPTSPIDIVRPREDDDDAMERERLASTPLLPPVMCGKVASSEKDWQSPLQSPTVADSNATFSAMNSPLGTPQAPMMQTPPLSTRPSIASFRHGRPGGMVPSSDIPPMTISDDDSEQDEWAEKLGHANFTILPKPYMPDVCDGAAYRELFANWERARLNFTKHLVRTGEHFGATSKTYRLTEQKWAEVDSQWKKFHDAAVACATWDGLDHATGPTPSEPPPLMTLPALEDPKKPGQFPKLGDEDIVGPMVQAAARSLPRSSKKASWAKFLSDIKSPGTFFARPNQQIGVGSR